MFMKKILLSFFIVIAAIGAQAQIGAVPSSGCAPFTTTLSAPTVSGAASWEWFVNGNPAGNTQTINNFPIPQSGSYGITLYVYDGNFNMIYNDYTYIIGYGFNNINTTLAANSACPGDRVNFYLNGYYPSGSISVSWNYGDGSPVVSGSNLSAEHEFNTLGNYTVTATVTSICGTQSLTYPVSVVTNAQIGNVYVQAQSDSVCPGDNIYFYHPSGDDNFIMDYGDGTVQSGSREHTYFLPGTYIVTCTFFNGCGNSAAATDTVHVVANIPISAYTNHFSISDTSVCPTTQVDFYPPGSFSQYNWNFGDGGTSTIYNPSHAYSTVGTYPVTLTITNGCGYSKTISQNVHVQNGIPVDPFSFSITDSICPNTSLLVDFNSVGDDIVYLNFGDGSTGTAQNQDETTHLYTNPGTYTITATQVNGCGLSYSTNNTIIVNAAATLDPAAFIVGAPTDHSCPNDSIFFLVSPPDIGAVTIDFGDGNSSSTPHDFLTGPDGTLYAIYKHSYSAVGQYNASATIVSPCGSTLTQSAGTIDVSSNNSVSNDAGFFFDESRYYCLNEPISFIAYGASNYEWDFGDGSGSLITNYSLLAVNHAYTAPGEYNIRVVMRNSCGAVDTFLRPIIIPDSYININTSTVSSHCNQSDGKAIAIVSGSNAPFSYNWTNADHSFIADSLSAGIYYVTITDSKGCSSFAVATVSDQQAPTISVNNVIDANCYGESSGAIDITLIGSSAPYTFVWSNGKTTEDVNQLVAGPYEVIVTDALGCQATKSVLVDQPDDFTISYVAYPSVCGFNTGVIQTSVQGSTGPYNYLWSNGFTGASLSGLSVGIYSLTVVDGNGCLKEKITSVNEQTAPIVVLDSVSVLDCNLSGNGADVYTSTYLGSSPYIYNWNNGASTPDLTNVAPGFYSLLVTGANGCKSILTVDVNEQIPQGLSICAVTVDSITQTNKVIWEMYSRTDIESFNIYRESSQAGLYYLVGNVDADSLHEFTDPSADPSIRGWRYKLSTVSFCGEESAKSDLHKTIHLTLNQGLGNTINLIWDNYEGLSFNKFYIWRYTTSIGWEKIDSIPSNLFSYTDLNAPNNTTSPDLYYYVEGGPLTLCDPTRGAINTSRSNIKSPNSVSIGIKSYGTIAQMSVYPNPTEGLLTVHMGRALTENAQLEVYNSLGALVSGSVLTAGSQDKTLDLSGLSNGVYFMKVKQSSGHSVQRIIINR
jgi:PKD repeat protein